MRRLGLFVVAVALMGLLSVQSDTLVIAADWVPIQSGGLGGSAPPTPPDGGTSAGDSPPFHCYNLTTTCPPICPPCNLTPNGNGGGGGFGNGGGGGGLGGGFGGGGNCATTGCPTGGNRTNNVPPYSFTTAGTGPNGPGGLSSHLESGNSLIDNISLSYIHYADDYPATEGSPVSLYLRRLHRYRNVTEISSFGPSVFCNYDTKIRFNSIYEVVLFDANDLYPVSFDPAGTGTLTPVYNRRIEKMLTLDAQDQLVSMTTATHAEVHTWTGEVYRFEMIVMDDDPGEYEVGKDARLIEITDRNGRSLEITYQTWTQAEIDASPERQWQIDTVTDYQGRTATFEYETQQVGGRWVVSEITFPNGETVEYAYANNQLDEVTHPDTSVSSFTYGYDQTTQCDTIEFDDLSADGTHRRKEVYVTTITTAWNDVIYGTSSSLVRMVVNGDDEVSYLNILAGTHQGYFYTGGGKMKYLDRVMNNNEERKVQYVKDGWTLSNTQNGPVITGTLESVYEQYTASTLDDMKQGMPSFTKNAQGKSITYDYDSDGWMLARYFPDNTYEGWCRNDFKQPTRYRDRNANVTYYTYDTRGNMLTKAVGLVETPGGSSGGYMYQDYDPCDTSNDQQTAEYAVYSWTYYAQSHANEYLLKSATDPEGNTTDYEYDSSDRISKVIEPADETSGTRAETTYAYDTAGRLKTVTDPDLATLTYDYDVRSRPIKRTYSDGTTERVFYGAVSSGDENLIVKRVDRRGVVTNYEYDDTGRLTKTIYAAALMDAAGTESAVSDPSVTIEETCTYLTGTSICKTRVRSGEKSELLVDYRGRVAQSTVHPNTNTTLTTKRTYVKNQLFETEDPYGRKQFYAYDASDGRLIRTIQGTVSSVSYTDEAAVLNKTRDADPAPNSTSIITDYIHDAEGQTVSMVDPRGLVHTTEYDSRGRAIVQVQAAEWADETATSVSARTETDYDDANNVVEVRSPRYFDSNDTNGYQKAKTVLTYTGRNKLKTRTEAPGTNEAATEEFVYTIDGKVDTRTDARGKDWVSMYPTCCNRETATVDPLGHGVITNRDANGNVTHQIWVEDVSTHTDFNNPTDAKTLREVTTEYDERNRPIATTVWLSAQGTVDPDDPPIANNPANGLTTTYTYDDDLDDSSGLDSTFSTHLTGLGLGTDADGSATLVTNPEDERTLSIRDGRGRTLRTVQLADDDSALTQSTVTYDAIVNISGYGNVLETAQKNLLNETTKSRTDAAGRTIESVDAANKLTTFEYDASSNRLEYRDPNNIGLDCDYDELNRDIVCTDTGNDTTETVFNLAGLPVTQTDAKDNDTTHTYDARGRRLTTTDRIAATTTWTWDAAGNELSMTDAENSTTSYEYDDANRRTQTTWPDHVVATNLGDADYGITAVAYYADGKMERRTDQTGYTHTSIYDLAGRKTSAEHRTLANSPSGTVEYEDTMTYDDAGRMLNGVQDEANVTTTFTYDEGGRVATEATTVYTQTHTVSRTYDDAGRLESLTYPDGSIVTRDYTNRGLLDEVEHDLDGAGGNAPVDVASFTYDDGGRETSRTYGNSVQTDRDYVTGENLVEDITVVNHTALSFDYAYDANKNVTSETRGGALSGYGFTTPSGYDDEDRLVNWERDDTNLDQSWNLSDVGDWDSYTENQATENRTHNDVHELTAIESTSLTYDSRGNLTQDHEGRQFAFSNTNGLMASTTRNTASTGFDASYKYDILGRRVSKQVDDDSDTTTVVRYTIFVPTLAILPPLGNQGGQVVAEYERADAGTWSLARTFTYGSYVDEPLTMVDYTDAGSTSAGTAETFTYHHNRIYNVAGLTDSSGNLVESYAYRPYGGVDVFDASFASINNTALGNEYLFTGRRFDMQSGLFYFRARYVHAALGRFTSRDFVHYASGNNLYCAYFVFSTMDPNGLIPYCGFYGVPCTPAPPANIPRRCIFTMSDPASQSRWDADARRLHRRSGRGSVILTGVRNPSVIPALIRSSGCCEVTMIGHRGGVDNAGIETAGHTRIIPNNDLADQIGRAMSENGCTTCDIRVLACQLRADPASCRRFGENQQQQQQAEDSNFQNYANRTRCNVSTPGTLISIGFHHTCVPGGTVNEDGNSLSDPLLPPYVPQRGRGRIGTP